ncbi:bifunctional YncE family protein/alkaline phosphatase family protein [Singulisphaera sp. Ch08]|uniref:Bifunctional YncE family protein/alkaline phosphatase family protein n=1 Tax=Singulisphaera sp. Ch08 TaxID=3120278 RepID=A0AAU7CCU0_9BACT
MPLPPRRLLTLFVLTLIATSSSRADERDRLKVGRQPDGRIVVPTNQILNPAGIQVLFPGRPVDLALIDDGRTLVVKNLKDLIFVDSSTGKIRQTLTSRAGFSVTGLLVEEGRVYATDAKDEVQIAARMNGDEYSWIKSVKLKKPAVKGAAHPAGIARLSDKAIWVTSTRGNTVQLVNLASGKVEQNIQVGVAPYTVCCVSPDLCYVTNWGGNPPKEGDPQADSSGTPARVDSRGIADHGTVSVVKRTDGVWRQVRSIDVGLHPSGMISDPAGRFVYVANANSDTVSVIRTETDEVVETISCRPEGRLPFGSGCNALALSPNGETLYVANGTNNCIAVVRLGARSSSSKSNPPQSQDSRLSGLIPTGWYPGAVLVSNDGKTLFVANIKGVGSLSRLKGNEREPRPEKEGMNSHDYLGSVSIIPVPDDEQLAKQTAEVNTNNRLAYSLTGLEKARPDVAAVPVPQRHGEPSVFKHVIYVIKENRTYDQVFGDMAEGNGDPNLVMFGEDVTPNHHKLAREFTLFDNFYCSGVLSADGHQWVNEAYVTDYLEKAFGGFTRSYPYEGSDPLAFASSGFLWDNALERKKTFFNFGEFVKGSAPKGATWADMYEEFKTNAGKFKVEAKVNVKSLEPYSHPAYPGFVMSIPDVYRAKLFIKELAEYERKGEFPNLVYLFLPCDHTSGTRPGSPTPRAMVADNDLALGQVVEAVSKSQFWKDTCFFIVEDDPQAGFDHVDSHRTVALVISPYTKRKYVDSTSYNQTGMVKTIELILGLPPMNQLDLSATAMRDCFQAKPDLTPYTLTPNRIELDEMNPPLAKLTGQALHWAKESLALDLDEADEADENTFNRILWYAARGESAPYPAKFVGTEQETP